MEASGGGFKQRDPMGDAQLRNEVCLVDPHAWNACHFTLRDGRASLCILLSAVPAGVVI